MGERRAGRLVRREPSPGRKSSSRLWGAGDGRFQRSSHPGRRVQAGGGLDGATVVSGVHGRETAGSGGTEGLDGVRDKEWMNEVK